jgi:hypothetical protein
MKFLSNVKVDQKSNKKFNQIHQTNKHLCYKVSACKGLNSGVNNIEFYCFTDECDRKIIHVLDKDCQLERRFVIGRLQWLGDFQEEKDKELLVLIESNEQVVNAWASGKVWF